MDISRWFDVAGFLEALKAYINRMQGRRFLTFFMADGHVSCQVKVLEEVVRKQAERACCVEIATMGHQDLCMRQALFCCNKVINAAIFLIIRLHQPPFGAFGRTSSSLPVTVQ